MEQEHHGYIVFTAAAIVFGMIGWVLLCHRSILKRRLTIADLLALLLVIGVVLGVCSWYGKF